MHIQRIIKKLLALIIGYAIFIFGIFIVQFKNSSTISERIGAMHITLATENDAGNLENEIVLQNSMNVSFRGMSFVSNERNPITVVKYGSMTKDGIVLLSWEKISDLSCKFIFSENVVLNFFVSDTSDDATLNIRAELPDDMETIFVPYSVSSTFSKNRQHESLLTITNRNKSRVFSADEIGDRNFSLTVTYSVASYRVMEQHELFAFGDIPESENTSVNTYNNLLSSFNAAVISTIGEAYNNSANVQTTETEAVAFVAAMAQSNGRYAEAVSKVPGDFRTGGRRTYLSTPYFNSLVSANNSLSLQITTWRNAVRNALSYRPENPEITPLSVLAMNGIEHYINVYRNSNDISMLLESASDDAISMGNEISFSNAVSLIRIFNFLSRARLKQAAVLSDAAAAACDALEAMASFNGSTLIFSAGGEILSVVDTALVADALLQYGQISGNADCGKAGYLMMNSLLANVSSFDRQTLAALYPIIIHDNLWYPHTLVFDDDAAKPVWAWTVAQNVRYTRNENSMEFEIEFPETFVHHIIFRGIEPFNQVLIYGEPYRTDLRFESYNASGYVYNAESEAFLLRSRHRSRTESLVIRFPSKTTVEATQIGED